MCRDPGRYLVIPGDKLMRLPSYTPQDEKELIQTLSMPIEGPEVIMDAEEYLQPKLQQAAFDITEPPTPIKVIPFAFWMSQNVTFTNNFV